MIETIGNHLKETMVIKQKKDMK